MNRKHLLVHVSALALGAFGLANQASATIVVQDDDKTQTPAEAKRAEAARRAKAKAAELAQSSSTPVNDSDIIVTGVRSSLAKAREKKRTSDTIVDVVEADDIGKLPNNTIGDVVASIPGISVFRSEGEVNEISLRGLSGVQTTLGGTPIESGADRVASIADLPADLVQSVEVYKTRTPDQVEGSGAGTINIQLRKPTDFKDGFFFAGNAGARYNNQSRQYNQVYTATANYRRDTAIGNVGVQLGFTINHNPFLESNARNEPLQEVQPRQVVGPNILPLPTFAPRSAAFFYTTGSRTTPTFNGSLAWSPTRDTSLQFEALYAAPRFDRYSNQLFMPITEQFGSANTLPALSNVTLVPGTNRLASVTASPLTRIGPIALLSESKDSNFVYKLSGRHQSGIAELSTEIAYTGSNVKFGLLEIRNRFVNRPTYDVQFANDEFGYQQMTLQFRDLDLLDPNQYRFTGLIEGQFRAQNRTFATRADITLRPNWNPIAYLKAGLRFSDRNVTRRERRRVSENLLIDPAMLPDGFNTLVPIAEGFGGTRVKNNARWLSYDREAARGNYDEMRQFLSQYVPAFATEDAPELTNRNFDGREQSVAAYATLGYKTKLLLPIDGIIGARMTNTIVDNRSLLFRNLTVRLPTGGTVIVPQVLPVGGSGNYLNIEPTATLVAHFTNKMQMRFSYSVGISRPNADLTTPTLIAADNTNSLFFTGNPELLPQKTTRYDASFEYYFGRTGVLTINPFHWQLVGTPTFFDVREVVEEGDVGETTVRRPYNSGTGYRRGVETQVQTFFTFLPGILKNFGASFNYTYIDSELSFSQVPGAINQAPATLPIVLLPKHVYNVAGLFERGTLNARISYNYNSATLDSITTNFIRGSTYRSPRDWMDAAINYSIPNGPLRNLGFSIQVQNVLASVRRSYYGFPDQPRDVTYMARTIGGTVRYKF